MLGDKHFLGPMSHSIKTALHVVSSASYFIEATILDAHRDTYDQSDQSVHVALMKCWWATYTIYSNRFVFNHCCISTSGE